MFQNTIRLQDVRRLLKSAQDLELSSGAVQRLKWFLYALEHENNVSLTCRHFGIARSTFLRWIERFDATDIATIEENSRRPKTVRQSEVDPKIIDIIRSIRELAPKLGKEIIAEKLSVEHGITLSASTVGRIITRHKLFFGETRAHQEKRYTEDASTSTDTPIVTEPTISTSLPPGIQKEGNLDDPYPFLPVPGLSS